MNKIKEYKWPNIIFISKYINNKIISPPTRDAAQAKLMGLDANSPRISLTLHETSRFLTNIIWIR